MFLKRHKWLSILFLVSIILIVKNSSIPYIGTPCLWWAWIFNQPQNEFAIEVMNIMELFAVAYSTSLLFYYIVSFRPAIKREKEAVEIIEKKLVSLYLYLSELIAMITYSAEISGIEYNSDISKLDGLSFFNEPVFCKKITISKGEESKALAHNYNLVETGNLYKCNILGSCNDVMNTPSFIDCDNKLKDIITRLLLSDALRILPKAGSFFVVNRIDIVWVGFGQGYQELCDIKKEIGPYVSKRIDSKFIEITETEIKKWVDDNLTMQQDHPEAAQLLRQIQGEN